MKKVSINDLIEFYDKYMSKVFGHSDEGDPTLVEEDHHNRPGFIVHRYLEGMAWFAEDARRTYGEKFVGDTHVYAGDNTLALVLQYHGKITLNHVGENVSTQQEELLAFRRKALSVRPSQSSLFCPFGPRVWSENGFEYSSHFHGTISDFHGLETISLMKKNSFGPELCRMEFSGGLFCDAE